MHPVLIFIAGFDPFTSITAEVTRYKPSHAEVMTQDFHPYGLTKDLFTSVTRHFSPQEKMCCCGSNMGTPAVVQTWGLPGDTLFLINIERFLRTASQPDISQT